MIESSQIETQLLAFVQHEVFAPDMGVTAETDLIAAGFDSMSLVRVLLFVELTYGLWIPERELNSVTLRNLRSLTATVARLLNGDSRPS
jgi:acyl carrier protein